MSNNIEELEEHVFELCNHFYDIMKLCRVNSNWPVEYKQSIKVIDDAMEYIGEEKLCG